MEQMHKFIDRKLSGGAVGRAKPYIDRDLLWSCGAKLYIVRELSVDVPLQQSVWWSRM